MNMKSVFNSVLVDAMSMKTNSVMLWVLIIVAMSGVVVVNMKAISFIFLVRVISLLFMNNEKGIHATNFAPINKKSSVYGRYMFVLLSFVSCLAINLLADVFASIFYAEYIQPRPLFYVLIFVIFIVLTSIEMPLLYWKGYSKVSVFQYVIFMGILLLITKVVEPGKLIAFIEGMNISVQVTLLLIVASIVVFLCSLLMSVKVYTRKDI